MANNKTVLVVADANFGATGTHALGAALTDAGYGLSSLTIGGEDLGVIKQALDHAGFDQLMRAARLVVIAASKLAPENIQRSVASEVATRARQSGIPCAAVTFSNELDRFSARIYDLYPVLVLEKSNDLSQVADQLLPTLG